MKTIFEQNRDKTRVLLVGKELSKLFFHVLDFHGKEVDKISENESERKGSDFLVFCSDNPQQTEDFLPNIVFLEADFAILETSTLLENITGGGVLVYSENSYSISKKLETSTNYFRKLAFQELAFEKHGENATIATEIGTLPLSFSDDRLIRNLDGLRLLCQQFGIMEEEYYEAVLAYDA